MRIAVIGATGWLGGTVAREALSRGHEVTAISRHPDRGEGLDGAARVVADVTEADAIAAAVAGHDVVVSAVTDRTSGDRSLIPATARLLLRALPQAGVSRLAWVGGGGSLETTPGLRTVDEPDFPDAYKAEALAQAEALAIFRAEGGELDWTYLSPPPHHLVPGDKTGAYEVRGGDDALPGPSGEYRIAAGDFAAALVDELEQPQFTRRRFTAAS